MIRVARLELLPGREGAKNKQKLIKKNFAFKKSYRLNKLQYLAHNLGDAIEAGDNRQHTKLWFFRVFWKEKKCRQVLVNCELKNAKKIVKKKAKANFCNEKQKIEKENEEKGQGKSRRRWWGKMN